MLHDPRHGNQLICVEWNICLAKFGPVNSSRWAHDNPVGDFNCLVEKYGSPHVYVSPQPSGSVPVNVNTYIEPFQAITVDDFIRMGKQLVVKMPVIILLDEEIRFGVQGNFNSGRSKGLYQNDGKFIVDKTGFTLVVISHSTHVSCKYKQIL